MQQNDGLADGYCAQRSELPHSACFRVMAYLHCDAGRGSARSLPSSGSVRPPTALTHGAAGRWPWQCSFAAFPCAPHPAALLTHGAAGAQLTADLAAAEAAHAAEPAGVEAIVWHARRLGCD